MQTLSYTTPSVYPHTERDKCYIALAQLHFFQLINNLWDLLVFPHPKKLKVLFTVLWSAYSSDCSSASLQLSIKLIYWICLPLSFFFTSCVLNQSSEVECQQLRNFFCQFSMNFAIQYYCLYTLKLQKALKQQNHSCQMQVTENPGSFLHLCTFQNAIEGTETLLSRRIFC